MLHELGIPIMGVSLFQVDADVEKPVVPCSLRKALCAEGLQTRRPVRNGLVWFWWRAYIRDFILHMAVIQLVELFQACGRAIIFDGVTHAFITCEIGQVQKVARVATVNKNFGLLREDFPACFTK